MKAMALNPDDRYSNATAMLYDLEEFRKNPSILFDFNDKADVDAATMLNNMAASQERVVPSREPRQNGSPVYIRTVRLSPERPVLRQDPMHLRLSVPDEMQKAE